jgi:hypothetical protein
MIAKKYIMALLIALLSANLAISAVINIPVDYSTIQAGIDAAYPGDTVLVADGTYTGEGNRDIDFGGKNIFLKSENGPDVTSIDCESDGRGFFFHSGENSTTIVDGFTIINGYSTDGGGGILCLNSNPSIINNIIYGNSTVNTTINETIGGGGIFCENSSPLIMNNIICGNSVTATGYGETAGGGIYCRNSDAVISNNTIVKNSAYSGYWWFNEEWQFWIFIETGTGGGIGCSGSFPEITNNIVCFNSANWYGGGINGLDDLNPLVTCCDSYGNEGGDWGDYYPEAVLINGNISTDPLLCDTADGDYHLAYNSPCTPGNNTCGELIGALGIACGTNLTTISPAIMHAADAHPFGIVYASINIYNIEEGYNIYDIDTSSLIINGSISPMNFEYQSFDPIGEALNMSFPKSEFVLGYMPLWDTSMQSFTLTGQFNDLTEFSTVGWVKMIGHRSGDMNGDGFVNIFDVSYLLEFLYLAGPAPGILESADVNKDGMTNMFDITYLIAYLYLGGPEPV